MVFNAESAAAPPPPRPSATTGRSTRSSPCSGSRSTTCSTGPRRTIATHFDPNAVQISTLLSIKTGGCPEDCAYCPQSAHYRTGVASDKLMSREAVLAEARRAAGGRGHAVLHGRRLAIAAGWRRRERGRAGFRRQGARPGDLRDAGDAHPPTGRPAHARRASTSTTTTWTHPSRTTGRSSPPGRYQDRLDTLAHVREAGMHVCCGGILGMGESLEDRAELLRTLANLPEHPESVPINQLVRVEGTPMADAGAGRAARLRPDDRRGADPDAAVVRPALGGAGGHERGTPGPLLPRRGQLDLLRRETAHDAQPRHACGPSALRTPGTSPPGAGAMRVRAIPDRLSRNCGWATERGPIIAPRAVNGVTWMAVPCRSGAFVAESRPTSGRVA